MSKTNVADFFRVFYINFINFYALDFFFFVRWEKTVFYMTFCVILFISFSNIKIHEVNGTIFLMTLMGNVDEICSVKVFGGVAWKAPICKKQII